MKMPIQHKIVNQEQITVPFPQGPHHSGQVSFHLLSHASLPHLQLNLVEKSPILNLKRLPDPRRILNRILNQLPLLPNLHIDLLLRILALDMRHINRDQDVRAIALQPDQSEHDCCEIRVLGAGLRWWGLCGNKRVGRDVFSVMMCEHVI
jgi:hypothetical protein